MALRISGGDWSPWARVASGLASEAARDRELDLRAQQLRLQRRIAQSQAYMQRLGLQERQRQFDEELAAREYKDAILAQQRGQELAFKMERAAYGRGLDEAETAVRLGAVLDTATNKWRPITEDDELYGAHKEYVASRRRATNQDIEMNRRIRLVDSRIRAGEKKIAELQRARMAAEVLDQPGELKRVDTEIEKAQKQLRKDRALYNRIHARFFKGYGSEPPPAAPSPADAASPSPPPAPASRQADFDPETAGPAAAPPREDRIQVGGVKYDVLPKYREQVRKDRIRLLKEIMRARRDGNVKKLRKLLKERREYIAKHPQWFSPTTLNDPSGVFGQREGFEGLNFAPEQMPMSPGGSPSWIQSE